MNHPLHEETRPLTLLKYFSIFRHPLRLEEILRFSGPETNSSELALYLDDLAAAGTIFKMDDYYLFQKDETAINKRLDGEVMANKMLPRARQVGRWIASFPFVRFVGISGSLSKGYANEQTDFDFFIITANNTLWICRTLLHLVKKLSFLAGKQHWMCMNYFMDEQHLELEERNIFTQIELSTLIPLGNDAVHRKLLISNKANLPNLEHLLGAVPEEELLAATAIKEKNKAWKGLNKWLMQFTDYKWKRKWKKRGYPMEDYKLAFKTTPYISKNHPKNYQKMVLKQLQKDSL